MLLSIDKLNKAVEERTDKLTFKQYDNVEVIDETESNIVWKRIRRSSTRYFSSEQLTDIRAAQRDIRRNTLGDDPFSGHNDSKYVVFCSEDPEVFSLGGDLRYFRNCILKRDKEALHRYALDAVEAVYNHSIANGVGTSISLVRGLAMGGGFEAAIAGNILIAERNAKMGFPEVLFGLFPGMGAYTFLREKVGRKTAENIIFSAKNYSAEELYEIGVVDVLAEEGSGESAVRQYIQRESFKPGIARFRNTINSCASIRKEDLFSIAQKWADTALSLRENDLNRIGKLISNQAKLFPSHNTQPTAVAAN